MSVLRKQVFYNNFFNPEANNIIGVTLLLDQVLDNNPAMLIAASFLMTVVGIVFCFWGKKIVEVLAFVIFGIIFGILGLLIGLFLAGFFSLGGYLFLIVVFGLCLLGIILGAVLGKFFLRIAVVMYCAMNAFFFTMVVVSTMTNNPWIPMIAGMVAALVVAIIIKMLFDKILVAVTAFFGASLVGMAVFIVVITVAALPSIDYQFKGLYIYGLLGAALGVTVVLGIAGLFKQLKGKSAPKQQQPRRNRGGGGRQQSQGNRGGGRRRR